MGKWAQQKKRGSSVGIHLPPPPRPLLRDIADEAVQTATGADDTGGTCTLQTSGDGGLSWDFADTRAWEEEIVWGDVGDFTGLLLRCWESGNGTVYQGDSPWSLILDLS